MKTASRHSTFALGALALATSLPAPAQPKAAERLHAQAVQSFREGRFPDAYGRFVALAGAGHPASARYALWMCEFGPELFGSDWDCAPHEVEDWARLVGIAPPAISARHYRAVPLPAVPGEGRAVRQARR